MAKSCSSRRIVSILFLIYCSQMIVCCEAMKNAVLDHNLISRQSKIFPPFGIVSLANVACRGRGTLNGTCVSALQCGTAGGGRISGFCSTGFSFCCVYELSCDSTTKANVSYFISSNASNNEARTCVVRIYKTNPNVVQLRLDFDIFSMNGVRDGQCSTDVFRVTGHNDDQVIPPICGINNGQHIFVNVGSSRGPVNLTVTTSGSGNRQWRIRVMQLDRRNPNLAPEGCLQHFTAPSGFIKSFNFDSPPPISGQANYVNNLNYAMCVDRQAGNCQSRFTAANEINSFDLETPDAMSGVDGSCLGDYLVIPGSRNAPAADNGLNAPIGSRFCGVALSATAASAASNPIISGLNGPIQINFVTNGQTPSGSSDRGFSLTYQQIPCTASTGK